MIQLVLEITTPVCVTTYPDLPGRQEDAGTSYSFRFVANKHIGPQTVVHVVPEDGRKRTTSLGIQYPYPVLGHANLSFFFLKISTRVNKASMELDCTLGKEPLLK